MSKWLVSCYEGLGAQQLCCRKLYICFQEGVFWWTRWRTVRRMSELSVNIISYKEQKLAWGKTIISTMKGQYTLSMTKALFTLQPLKPGWNQPGVNTLPPRVENLIFQLCIQHSFDSHLSCANPSLFRPGASTTLQWRGTIHTCTLQAGPCWVSVVICVPCMYV